MLILKIRLSPGSKARRIKVPHLPFTIGRSIENALVLDDPLISAQHAVIEARSDGSHFIVDRGSTNGIFIDGVKKPEAALRHNATVRLGAAEIEFQFHSENLEKTRDILLTDVANQARAQSVVKSVLLTVLLFGVFVGTRYLNSFTTYHGDKPATVLLKIVKSYLNSYLLYAAGISLLSKIITRQFRLLRILRVSTAVAFAYDAVYWILIAIGNVDSEPLRIFFQNVLYVVYWTTAVFFFSRIIFELSLRWRLLVYSFGIVLSYTAILFVDSHFIRVQTYVGTLAYPIRTYSERGRSVDDLLKAMQSTAGKMQASMKGH